MFHLAMPWHAVLHLICEAFGMGGGTAHNSLFLLFAHTALPLPIQTCILHATMLTPSASSPLLYLGPAQKQKS